MKNPQRRRFLQQGGALGAVLLWSATTAMAADESSHTLTFQDDKVVPATLTVPAGQRVKLEIKNARSVPAEFESAELGREKVVPGGTTLNLWIGPLKPGKYKFFDDFNPSVVGWIEATDAKR
jgi:heme/copper-type cytochrome/quinol oxidase subunit 2